MLIYKKKITIIFMILFSAMTVFTQQSSQVDKGIDFFNESRLNEAEEIFNSILKKDSGNHRALFFLGRIRLKKEDFDGAATCLKKAAELNPTSSAYFTWLGRTYLSKLQKASHFERGILAGKVLDAYKKAVKLDPENVQARISLAGYYLNAPSIAGGSKRKALEQIKEIIKSNPETGHMLMAQSLIKDGKYNEAEKELLKVIELTPDQPEIYYRMGMLYQSAKAYGKAFTSFETAVKKDPRDLRSLYQIGRTAVFSDENLMRGIECLKEYIEKEPKNGLPGIDAAHWRLGMLFEKSGKMGKARKEYQTAIKLNPGESKYKKCLENLDKN